MKPLDLESRLAAAVRNGTKDVVARKLVLRRERWSEIEKMTARLKAERGIVATPAEIAAIVLDAGLATVGPDGAPLPEPVPVAFVKPLSPVECLKALAEAIKQRDEEILRLGAELESAKQRPEPTEAEQDASLEMRASDLTRQLDEALQKIEELEELPSAAELEKKLKEAEERIEKLEDEAGGEDERTVEAIKEAKDEWALEGAEDAAVVAAWAFSNGASWVEIGSLGLSSEAAEAVARAYWREQPNQPKGCWPLWDALAPVVAARRAWASPDGCPIDGGEPAPVKAPRRKK